LAACDGCDLSLEESGKVQPRLFANAKEKPMARLLRAVARYGPRVEDGSKVGLPELSSQISASSELDKNVAAMAITELSSALGSLLKQGTPVVIPGMGRLRLTVDRYGELRLNFVADKELREQVQDPDSFAGSIQRAEAAGWTDADYKTAWDAEFPDDPLELPATSRKAKRYVGPGRPSKKPTRRDSQLQEREDAARSRRTGRRQNDSGRRERALAGEHPVASL
jgi:hypothetical protein